MNPQGEKAKEAETPDMRQYREDVEAGVDMRGTTDALIPKITENSNLQKQVVPDAVKGWREQLREDFADYAMHRLLGSESYFDNLIRTIEALLEKHGKERELKGHMECRANAVVEIDEAYKRGREDEAIDHQKEDLDARRAVLEEVMEEIAKERTPRPKGDDSTIQVTDWMAKDDALDSIASVVKGLIDKETPCEK